MQRFLFFVCAAVCPLLHGMEDVMGNNKSFNNDYREQRTIAMLSKTCNKMIEDNYRPDKKHIEWWMWAQGTPITRGEVSWNKDFSKCAYASIEPITIESDKKQLKLILIGLDDQRNLVTIRGRWNNYMFPVFDEIVFNKEGGIYFYASGHCNLYHSPGGIFMEYSLGFDGTIDNKRCFIETEKETVNDLMEKETVYCAHDFHRLLNLPVLLKAFLQSTKVCEYPDFAVDKVHKAYCLSGVIIPDDYQLYKKHPVLSFLAYDSYDRLPAGFKNVIEKCYAQQHDEKNKIEDVV